MFVRDESGGDALNAGEHIASTDDLTCSTHQQWLRRMRYDWHMWGNHLQVLLGYMQLNACERAYAYTFDLAQQLHDDQRLASCCPDLVFAYLYTYVASPLPFDFLLRCPVTLRSDEMRDGKVNSFSPLGMTTSPKQWLDAYATDICALIKALLRGVEGAVSRVQGVSNVYTVQATVSFEGMYWTFALTYEGDFAYERLAQAMIHVREMKAFQHAHATLRWECCCCTHTSHLVLMICLPVPEAMSTG